MRIPDPCMCGADDCPSCYPVQHHNGTVWFNRRREDEDTYLPPVEDEDE